MDLTHSFQDVIPERVQARYELYEVRNAAGVLKVTNPKQFGDLIEVLDAFSVYTDDLVLPGGQESKLAARLNGAFRTRGWREAKVDTIVELNLSRKPFGGEPKPPDVRTRVENEGYLVDNFVGRVALDVEWNAKDGNLDRDLAAYRFLYDYGLIDVAAIITRTQGPLRELGRRLGMQAGMSANQAKRILGTTTTTNTDKLIPRLTRGDSGGCPLLVVAISADTWAGEGVLPPAGSVEARTEDYAEEPVVSPDS